MERAIRKKLKKDASYIKIYIHNKLVKRETISVWFNYLANPKWIRKTPKQTEMLLKLVLQWGHVSGESKGYKNKLSEKQNVEIYEKNNTQTRNYAPQEVKM